MKFTLKYGPFGSLLCKTINIKILKIEHIAVAYGNGFQLRIHVSKYYISYVVCVLLYVKTVMYVLHILKMISYLNLFGNYFIKTYKVICKHIKI